MLFILKERVVSEFSPRRDFSFLILSLVKGYSRVHLSELLSFVPLNGMLLLYNGMPRTCCVVCPSKSRRTLKKRPRFITELAAGPSAFAVATFHQLVTVFRSELLVVPRNPWYLEKGVSERREKVRVGRRTWQRKWEKKSKWARNVEHANKMSGMKKKTKNKLFGWQFASLPDYSKL